MEKTPQLLPQHKAMEAFVGGWKINGKNLEGAEGSAGTTVEADGSYTLLPGGFFLELRETAHFGDQQHITLMIMGYDEASLQYPVSFFDNTGYSRVYQGSLRKNTWTISGERERATYTFGDDGNSYTSFWERSFDGANWVPLCELSATRSV